MTPPPDLKSTRINFYLQELSKNLSKSELEALILEATKDPEVFHFHDLLIHPSIASLQTSSPPFYELLQLFSHHTLSHYHKLKSDYPPLTDAHISKLQILTLLSAAHGRTQLSYDTLLSELNVSTIADLEKIIRDTIYANLLRGKMDQSGRILYISSSQARDALPESIQGMISNLRSFITRADDLIREIDDNIKVIGNHSQNLRTAKAEHAQQQEQLRMQIIAAHPNKYRHV